MQPYKYKIRVDRCLFLGMAFQPDVAGMCRKHMKAEPGLLHNSTLCSARLSIRPQHTAKKLAAFSFNINIRGLVLYPSLPLLSLGVSQAAKPV